MNYNGVNIHFCWLPFIQGIALTSKHCLVKYVKDPTGKYIHLKSTCEVILHELDHCSKIKRLGWLNFMSTILWSYLWKGYSRTDWELDAEKAEVNYRTVINLLEIRLKQKKLLYY